MPSRSSLVMRVCVRLCLGLVLLAGLCLALDVQVRPAHAQATLTVTDCSSDSMLQTDVGTANMDNDGDIITFSCSGSQDIKLSQTLTISGNMTIDGSGQSITLDGQQRFGVFLVNGGANLTLKALTISNGVAPFNSSFQVSFGGGIDNMGGTVSISNSTVSNNSAPAGGSGGFGGGISNVSGTVIVANSTVSNNSATNTGGGISNINGGTLTVTDSTVSNNSAGNFGGGIGNNVGATTIVRTTVSNNSASGIGGGGIGNFADSVTITSSTVSHNSANQTGGGIDTFSGTTTIVNSTVANNSANGIGGGIGNGNSDFQSSGTTTITNSTVANNSASSGGGVDNINGGTLTMLANIIANNTVGDCAGGPTDQGYNLSSDSSCSFTTTTSLPSKIPQLGPLANNGGPTQTMALQQGSPAIDAGPPTGGCPTTDQRADARPDNGEATCDIGAYEFQDPLDNDLALINMPANITTNATSPSGAVVTYTAPTVVDEDSPLPSVNCSPASGSPFAITTTTVTCTVTDSDDSNSPVSKSFTVTVKGAAAQVGDQISVVQGLPIASGLKSSLVTQLQTVQADLSANNTAQACLDLKSYINHVKAQSGKGLTVSQANQLLAAATNIQHVLAC